MNLFLLKKNILLLVILTMFSACLFGIHIKNANAATTGPLFIELSTLPNGEYNNVINDGEVVTKLKVVIGTPEGNRLSCDGDECDFLITFSNAWKMSTDTNRRGAMSLVGVSGKIIEGDDWRAPNKITETTAGTNFYDYSERGIQDKFNLSIRLKHYHDTDLLTADFVILELTLVDYIEPLPEITLTVDTSILNPTITVKYGHAIPGAIKEPIDHETEPFDIGAAGFILYDINPASINVVFPAIPNGEIPAGAILIPPPSILINGLLDVEGNPINYKPSAGNPIVTAEIEVADDGQKGRLECIAEEGLETKQTVTEEKLAADNTIGDPLKIECDKWKISPDTGTDINKVDITIIDRRTGAPIRLGTIRKTLYAETITSDVGSIAIEWISPPDDFNKIKKGEELTFNIQRYDTVGNPISSGEPFTVEIEADKYEGLLYEGFNTFYDGGNFTLGAPLIEGGGFTDTDQFTIRALLEGGSRITVHDTSDGSFENSKDTTITAYILPNHLVITPEQPATMLVGEPFDFTLSPKNIHYLSEVIITGNVLNFTAVLNFPEGVHKVSDALGEIQQEQGITYPIQFTDDTSEHKITVVYYKPLPNLNIQAQDLTKEMSEPVSINAGYPAKISFKNPNGTPVLQGNPIRTITGTSNDITIIIKDVGGNPIPHSVHSVTATVTILGDNFEEKTEEDKPIGENGEIVFTVKSSGVGMDNTLKVEITSEPLGVDDDGQRLPVLSVENPVSVSADVLIGSLCITGKSSECNGGQKNGMLECVKDVCLGKKGADCTDIASETNFPQSKRCVLGFACSGDVVNGPAKCQGDFGKSQTGSLKLGEETSDIRIEINRVINILLSFLAIIGIILILYGGILWATSGGNDEQAGKARKVIIAAAAGLIIIGIAWTITSYVINLGQGIS